MYDTRTAGTRADPRPRLSWPQGRDFRILSIDGGGIRGILPAAVLAELEARWLGGRSIAAHFDLIAGTSTGGIIALGLAAGLSAREILSLYTERGGEIFPERSPLRRKIATAGRVFAAGYDPEVLTRLCTEFFGPRRLWNAARRLCIPAVVANSFEPIIYKTPHHEDYVLDWNVAMVDVARATSAAQTYFPAHEAGGYMLIDGGLFANNPVRIAAIEAVSCFDIVPRQVKILSLGCVESAYAISDAQKEGGMWSWKDAVFHAMHLQSQNALGETGLLIGRDRLVRIDHPRIVPAIDLDDWKRSRELLPPRAQALVEKHGRHIAEQFLDRQADPYRPLYTEASPPPPRAAA